MLFVMLNQVYPFDRHEGKEEMYAKQMNRDYHLSEEVERRCSDEAKDLIREMLEPDVKKRIDIFKVCQHPWFPIITREAELLGQVVITPTPGSLTNLVSRSSSTSRSKH